MQNIEIVSYIESHYPISTKIIKEAVELAIKHGPSKADMVVNVSVIGDRKMRELNRDFRGHDQTTDVLAFSYAQDYTPDEVRMKKLHLGEVVLSYPQIVKRAISDDTLVEEAAQFLVVHGVLHLLGYDHEKAEEAYTMENLEDKVMSQLTINKEKVQI